MTLNRRDKPLFWEREGTALRFPQTQPIENARGKFSFRTKLEVGLERSPQFARFANDVLKLNHDIFDNFVDTTAIGRVGGWVDVIHDVLLKNLVLHVRLREAAG